MNCFKAPFSPLIDFITRKIKKIMQPNGERSSENLNQTKTHLDDSGILIDIENSRPKKIVSRPSFDLSDLNETDSGNDSAYGRTPFLKKRPRRLLAMPISEKIEIPRCGKSGEQENPFLLEDSVRLYHGTEKTRRAPLSIIHTNSLPQFNGQKRTVLEEADHLWSEPTKENQLKLCTSLPTDYYRRKLPLRQQSAGPVEKGEFSSDSAHRALPGILEVVYTLPVLPDVTSQAFRFISRETLCGEFKRLGASFGDFYSLIDCRYHYEYEGGHIETATNVHDPALLEDFFFSDDQDEMGKTTKRIPIFYCEFSEVRGPRMANELRKIDRKRNAGRYPHVDYPEIYVLASGYKGIWQNRLDDANQIEGFCTPSGYIAMHDKRYSDDLRRFRQHKSRRNKPRPTAFSTQQRKRRSGPNFAKTPKKGFPISDSEDLASTPTNVAPGPIVFPTLDDSDDAERALK